MTIDFFDVALNQRACRDFATDDVPDADVERMLEAATHAPSAENTQPWEFVVVRDDATRQALAATTTRAWEMFVREHVERTHGEALKRNVTTGFEGGLARAPVVVVVALDSERWPEAMAGSSIFPATQNLLLAAGALGYGSILTTLLTFFADDVRKAIALPDHLHPMAVVYLGRPAKPLGPPRRRPVAEVAHRDRFGTRW